MIRPPFAARVAAGIAVTAVEEARKLPNTAATMPMTAVSQVLQTTMRVQQTMTALAIKGDHAFELLSWTRDSEQPEWAVFDEDTAPAASPDSPIAASESGEGTSADKSPGHFALYSLSPDDAPAAGNGADASLTAETPEIVTYLDYESLTLAQLRARLKTLSVEDLTALLEFEDATLARAPFQTMITNRITTAKAK